MKHFFNILLSCLGQFEDDVEHAVAGLNYVLQPDHARVVDSLQELNLNGKGGEVVKVYYANVSRDFFVNAQKSFFIVWCCM